MKRELVLCGLIVLLFTSATAFAQWLSLPLAGTPRTADGKPNLTGPAPRGADGKPDLSGIWSNIRPPAGQRGQGAAAATPPPPPPPPPPGTPPVATFRDVGAGFKEGLPLQPWAAELIDAAGGEFAGTPACQHSNDEITALNPDVIIAAWCGAGDRVPLEKIVADREWERTSAALSGRVFCIRDEFLNTPAPTLLQGLDALAWAIHPDVFPRTKGIRQITGVRGTYAENPTC